MNGPFPRSRSIDGSTAPTAMPVRRSVRRLIVLVVSTVVVAGLNPCPTTSEVEGQEASAGRDGTPTPDMRPGRWKRFRKKSIVGNEQSGDLSEKQIEKIRQLEALGYLRGVTAAPSVTGVTRNLRDRTSPGVNFYVSGHGPEAILINMEGEILHSWSFDFHTAFPDWNTKQPQWRRAYMYPNGDILAIWEGRALIRLNKDSQLKWHYARKPHHDLFVTEDGKIYVLSRSAGIDPSIHETEPVLHDFIDLLDEGGKLLKRLSILECFQNSEYRWPMMNVLREQLDHRHKQGKKLPGDIFHTNTIEVFDGSQEGFSPVFKKGNLLISLRTPSIVAVIDPEEVKVVWAASGLWLHQHDPIVLANGRMLIFDNEGNQGSSRVLELDPFSQEIFWKFEGDPPQQFHSRCCGTVQRLENGNTLVTETDNGRALEIAPDGTVVWEFVSPHRAGEDNELIAALYDMVRIPRDWNLDWLDN